MKIVINAGHTKFGTGTGAVGLLNESTETRRVAYQIMEQLAETSHEVFPAVFDRHESNLKAAVHIANENAADLFVSIHLNAGGGSGTEVYTWRGRQNARAVRAAKNLSALGFPNRGIKDGSALYVLRNTKCEALLVEVCFVDNATDRKAYMAAGVEKIARAIVDAIK